MNPLDSRFEGSIATFYQGERIAGELQLLTADDQVEDLRGRTFTATIYGPGRQDRVARATIAEDGTYAAWAFDGDVSAALYPAGGLRLQVAEILEDGRDALDDLQLRLLRGPISTAGIADPLPDTGPVTRFVLTRNGTGNRRVVSQRGGRGVTGDAGISPVLSIGTVAQSEPGGEGAAEIDNSDPAQPQLNLILPTGPVPDDDQVTEALVPIVDAKFAQTGMVPIVEALLAASPPLVATLPAINGAAIEGKTLTASGATFYGHVDSTAWQWLRDGVAIAGATNATYTLAAADRDKLVTVRRTATNAHGTSAPAVSQNTDTVLQRFVFAASPFGQPINGFYSPTAAQLNETVDQYLPPLPDGGWIVFVNFALSTSGSAGNNTAPPREQYPGNINTIDYAVTFSGANGTGTRTDCLFANGASSAVIASDGFAWLWVPPMPAGGWLRYSITTPAGGKRPQSRNISYPAVGNGLGDQRKWKAAFSATEKAGGAIGGTAIFGRGGYGGVYQLLVPWKGQASAVLFADSIGQQDDDRDWFASAADHGVVGFIPRGLDSATNGAIGVGNFTNHSTTELDFMNTASGYFCVRQAVIDYARNTLNRAREWPFTFIWSEHGRNMLAALELGLVAPTDNQVLAAMQGRYAAWWAYLQARYPGVPIVQNTITPKSNSTDNWTTLAGQTMREVGGSLALVNTWLKSAPAPLAKVVDTGAVPLAPDDGSGIPKWRVTALAAAGGGTVAAAVTTATSASGTGITINAPVAPTVGSYLVIEPGTANVEVISIVRLTDNGGGSYTVFGKTASNGANQAFTKAHAQGVAVSTADTSDGLHPGPVFHMGPMKAVVIAAKGAAPLAAA